MKTSSLLVCAFLIASCSTGSRSPAESELYLVRAQGADVIPSTTERALVRVAPVAVAPHIRGVAIVTDDGRVRTMVNQRFAAPLNALVEEAVSDRLRAAGKYGAVLSPSHPSTAPFVLRLTLRSFEIVVADYGYTARVVFDGLIERENDRAVVRAFRAGADRPTEGPAGGGFVRGLESALNGAIDALVTELDAAGVASLGSLLKPEPDPPPAVDPRTGRSG
jgi:ABC-type uncharacterized transport system auxiliary subunit